MISTHISCDHNTYHIRFRDTWLQREKEATRPFTFQPKALEMFENQYKSELLIRSHCRSREFESLQVHQKRHCFLQCLFSFICAILKSGFERTDGSERQAKKKILILLFYQNSKLNSYFFNKNICG